VKHSPNGWDLSRKNNGRFSWQTGHIERIDKDMKFSRKWAMPDGETFSIKPIREFVNKYLKQSKIVIDPFSRDADLATHTNDLNPKTKAKNHLDVLDFLTLLKKDKVLADLVLFDHHIHSVK